MQQFVIILSHNNLLSLDSIYYKIFLRLQHNNVTKMGARQNKVFQSTFKCVRMKRANNDDLVILIYVLAFEH